MACRKSLGAPVLLVAAFFLLVSAASAQDWKGRGRARGSVLDDAGKAIPGASVSLWYKGAKGAGPTFKTDKKGQWAYIGLVTGDFTVEIDAEGYVGAEASIRIDEYAPSATQPLEVKLRRADAAGGGGTASNAESDRLMQVLNAGNEKLKNKDFAGARAAYEEVMAAVKDDKQKLSLKAAIAGTWLDEGKGPEARAAFEELLASAPDPATQMAYLQRIARAYYIENNVDASVATLEKAVALDPANVTTLRLIIDILVASGREQQAEPYMAKLPAGEKIDPNAMLNLGITAYNAGDLETAVTKFDAVIKAYPDNADAWYYMGLTQIGRNKTAEAKTALETFLKLAPNDKHAEDAKQFLAYLK